MRSICSFITLFLIWTLIGVVSKVVFLLVYHSLLADVPLGDKLAVLWYGLRLDMAVAGYVTIIPGLLLIVGLWFKGKLLRWIWEGYFLLISILASLAFISNIGLYGYWGFPLDNTPILYIRTSPVDAMASLTMWQLIEAIVAFVVCCIVLYKIPHHIPCCNEKKAHIVSRVISCILLLLMDTMLLLPIRGGVGTGTNHTGSVYFSDNNRLNHAAVNPIFSFVESVTHQEEIGTKYRFMEDVEAEKLFKELTYSRLKENSEYINQHPNVILITLESFSDTIMGVYGITPNLRRLAREGIWFTNFYANSFRTDRALVSIHSGLPAQPTMSVMDIPHKSTSLPSIAGQLAKNGYKTVFYYGGDINYSNMRSYFMGTGFQQVVSESDFPSKKRISKWGVADGDVFDRMLTDIKLDKSGKPFFRSIMTESSHEPFDVPDYNKIRNNPVLNSFSYADYCLGKFVEELKKLPLWDNTIVAIVPDHLGAYPDIADNYVLWRYQTPFIIIGGSVDKMKCNVFGSQIDIAATLLGMLGIDHSEFVYSKDLLDESAPHFAYFTFPDAMGMVTDSNCIVYDNTSARIQYSSGKGTQMLLRKSQAYLQKLYDDLDKR